MHAAQMLKQYFGYEEFRQGQAPLIEHMLEGGDCLGIMPTGAGKSICFQVPALMLQGITLVISPLISLMKDQVNSLTQAGIPAAYINSSLTERQISMVLDRAKEGAYKLIYIAPERLLTEGFLSLVKGIQLSMLTVDEAHCISQWGQDFRPSYGKIPEFLAQLPKRPVVSAFTATATQRVREDILALLQLENPKVLVTGFDRENLYFAVQRPKDKFGALVDFLADKRGQNGVIYCATRNNVQEVCEKLQNAGYSASRYHAGLGDKERHENQDDFLYDRVQIMVATNAFGMGIDKSNVSFVVHYNMPRDVESYYQEAGRAGRDGEPAQCLLLYSGQDVRTHLWLIENGRDTENADEQLAAQLKERERERLKRMTFYCTTSECLRQFILSYFGETAPNFCGNCGSCNGNFDTVDITVEAQKILSCIGRMRERFGIVMVIDVLRGSKNERLLHLGLDKLSTYGISKATQKQLRQMLDYLIYNGILVKTNEEFPRLLLGERTGAILRGEEAVVMKLAKEQAATVHAQKQSNLRPVDQALFADLRTLRMEIAKEQSVPAFAVFPDSTLTDMCMKRPENQEQLLKISGVGQIKLERYGARFLAVLANHVDAAPNAQPQSLPALDTATIAVTQQPVTVSVLADTINSVLLQSGYQKLSSVKINNWLVAQGYMELLTENEKTYKIPTQAGAQLGITSQQREIRGVPVRVNLYGKQAQTMVATNAQEILAFEK